MLNITPDPLTDEEADRILDGLEDGTELSADDALRLGIYIGLNQSVTDGGVQNRIARILELGGIGDNYGN